VPGQTLSRGSEVLTHDCGNFIVYRLKTPLCCHLNFNVSTSTMISYVSDIVDCWCVHFWNCNELMGADTTLPTPALAHLNGCVLCSINVGADLTYTSFPDRRMLYRPGAMDGYSFSKGMSLFSG